MKSVLKITEVTGRFYQVMREKAVKISRSL